MVGVGSGAFEYNLLFDCVYIAQFIGNLNRFQRATQNLSLISLINPPSTVTVVSSPCSSKREDDPLCLCNRLHYNAIIFNYY